MPENVSSHNVGNENRCWMRIWPSPDASSERGWPFTSTTTSGKLRLAIGIFQAANPRTFNIHGAPIRTRRNLSCELFLIPKICLNASADHEKLGLAEVA